MNLLRRQVADPVAVAERELQQLQSRKLALEAKLRAADSELAVSIEQRRKRLVETDDEDVAGARDLIASLRDTVNLHADGVSEITARIVAVESRLAAERQRAERTAAAAELQVHSDSLATAVETFARAGAALVAAIGSIEGRVAHPTVGVEGAGFVVGDLMAAARQLVADGRAQAAMVAAGSTAALQPSPPRPQAPPVPEIARREIFSLRRLKWSDGGSIRSVERYCFVDAPADVAARAIARDVADVRGSHRVRSLVDLCGTRTARSGGGEFLYDGAIDLDAEQTAAA